MGERLTSKGQVTIPIAVREALGLRPGDEIGFVVENDTVRIMRTATRGEHVVARLRGRGDEPMTTAEIMALTRED
jgi:AbrB family looped-hinge helix DNA binding protein